MKDLEVQGERNTSRGVCNRFAVELVSERNLIYNLDELMCQ